MLKFDIKICLTCSRNSYRSCNRQNVLFWNVFQQNKGSFLNWIWLFYFELAKSQLKLDYSISNLTISFWTCYIPIQICLFYFEFAIFQLRFDYSILNLLCSNSGLTIPFQICLFHFEFAYFIFDLLSPNSNLISPKLNLQWYIIMQTHYKLWHLGGVPLATNHSNVPDQWAMHNILGWRGCLGLSFSCIHSILPGIRNKY